MITDGSERVPALPQSKRCVNHIKLEALIGQGVIFVSWAPLGRGKIFGGDCFALSWQCKGKGVDGSRCHALIIINFLLNYFFKNSCFEKFFRKVFFIIFIFCEIFFEIFFEIFHKIFFDNFLFKK